MKRGRSVAVAAGILWLLSFAAGGAEPLRGNTRSRVFHQSSCRYYKCTNCTAKFASAREAVDSGYRPCGICEPGGGARSESSRSATAAYVGNTNTHKFHRASCRYAKCPNCKAKFKSRGEAIESGYAPGGCCDP